ncbi:MAG: PAS domain-containing protein [Gemmatimonadaceae bacterium]|nr:PAS domain-containing protein [Gemmatimonadaceae bacterium]
MRITPISDETARKALLDSRGFVRWIYIARLSLAVALLVAALLAGGRPDPTDTIIASLAFAASVAFTAGSAWSSFVQRRPLGATFFYLQSLFDLALVTAVVHVTGRSASPFVALYILVIAAASLLLPPGGGLLVAALGNVVFFTDVILSRESAFDVALWLQLGIFGVVALGSGWIAGRLRQGAAGRDQLAAELVQARLEAADILHNIRSGIVTIDVEGRLLYANPAASALLDADLESRIGQPFLDWLQPLTPVLAGALRESITTRQRIVRAEGDVHRESGAMTIGVTTTAPEAPLDGQHGLATSTAIFQDISNNKRLESLRVRAERLEAVAELSASLAHEIRNPLASIRSAVEQLAQARHATEDDRVLGALVMRESDRLSRLLGEFLDFARTRATVIEPVDLGEVVRGATNLAAAHPSRAEDVTVSCSTPETPLVIEADEDLLHRAIFNLALNAVQAAPPGGRVDVDVLPLPADEVPAGSGFDNGAVALRVTDDGPGIPRDLRERMFDPFFTTQDGGTGLGLPVVHRAVEAHRGLVLVDTGTHGTRFTVLLPLAQSGSTEES